MSNDVASYADRAIALVASHTSDGRLLHLITITCRQCGTQFDKLTSNPTQPIKFCSRECRGIVRQPTETHQQRMARMRVRNRAFVAEVNARTACDHCGAQPIEWHNPEHVELNRQAYRISSLVQSGRPITVIQAEMDRCTPLCRRCHMAEDGRLKKFKLMAMKPKPQTPLRPCTTCQRLSKPLRHGLCSGCSSRQRYYRKTESGENVGAAERRMYAARRRAAS